MSSNRVAQDLAKEDIPPGEAEATQRLIALLQGRLEREYPAPARVLRDAHPKQHGLVRALFVVEPDLPSELRVGVFAAARTYPAWVRFSNMSDPPQPDVKKDSRGVAIKLMEVEGAKLLEKERSATTQDFVFMSTQFFVTKGVAEFAQLVESLERGTWRLLFHLLTHPRLLALFLRARQRCSSPLEITYGSTTPYLLGARAVKYALRPASAARTEFPAAPSADFLREAMVKHLASREARFDFLIQVQTDARNMPIEDPRVVWSERLSPMVKAAELRIPAQQFDTQAQRDFGDSLSFSPWHCLPEHRPLGGVNRARKLIYETMSAYRHARNSEPNPEPTGWVDF